MSHKPVRKAVIPVAGLGTRFLPATKAIPKELLPLVDKPVIQYIVEEAVASGIEEVIFVTNESKAAIEEYFSRNEALEALLDQKGKKDALEEVKNVTNLAQFVFVHQPDPLGLGHAVLQAKDVVGDEPFVVFGGDDVVQGPPAARQLIEVYEKYDGPVLGVMEVTADAVDRYGVMDTAEDLGGNVVRIQGITEKPTPEEAPSRLGVGGRWLLTPDIFPLLEQTEPGSGGEIQLSDAINALVKQREVYACIYDGIYRDCGNKVEYAKAVVAFALEHEEVGPAVRAFIHELDTK